MPTALRFLRLRLSVVCCLRGLAKPAEAATPLSSKSPGSTGGQSKGGSKRDATDMAKQDADDGGSNKRGAKQAEAPVAAMTMEQCESVIDSAMDVIKDPGAVNLVRRGSKQYLDFYINMYKVFIILCFLLINKLNTNKHKTRHF